MKGKWGVSSNTINGKKVYIVFRIRDVNQVVHSGNMEYAGEYTSNREEAQALAEQLNEQEEESCY